MSSSVRMWALISSSLHQLFIPSVTCSSIFPSPSAPSSKISPVLKGLDALCRQRVLPKVAHPSRLHGRLHPASCHAPFLPFLTCSALSSATSTSLRPFSSRMPKHLIAPWNKHPADFSLPETTCSFSCYCSLSILDVLSLFLIF